MSNTIQTNDKWEEVEMTRILSSDNHGHIAITETVI